MYILSDKIPISAMRRALEIFLGKTLTRLFDIGITDSIPLIYI